MSNKINSPSEKDVNIEDEKELKREVQSKVDYLLEKIKEGTVRNHELVGKSRELKIAKYFSLTCYERDEGISTSIQNPKETTPNMLISHFTNLYKSNAGGDRCLHKCSSTVSNDGKKSKYQGADSTYDLETISNRLDRIHKVIDEKQSTEVVETKKGEVSQTLSTIKI